MELPASILVVDDDDALSRVLAALLKQSSFEVVTVASGERALAALEAQPFDLVVSDLRMPGMGGMALLAEAARRWPTLPVLMLTAHGTVALAVEAMKAGASDFVLKPFDRDELLFCVRKALTATATATAAPPPVPVARDLIGESAAVREVQALIARVGPAHSTVLLLGESGTGKEVVARALHEASPRRSQPYVKLNCGALPDNLLESELFGYEKGAFTGAATRKPGRVELAQGGTLFLDEIGDITPHLQVKLLRVLQEREFERLGGTVTLKADVRFLAATNRNLAAMVAEGKYREDLYYRLNVVPVHLPPLRSRPEDIPALAHHFASQHRTSRGTTVAFTTEAVDLLRRAPWPGNVRQLQNLVERLVVLSDGPTISVVEVEHALQSSLLPSPQPISLHENPTGTLDAAMQQTERDAILDALTRAHGNRTVAARLLGVSRRALYYKLSEHQIG